MSENNLVHLFIIIIFIIFFIQDIYYSHYKELITKKKTGAIPECGLFYKELINT